MIRHHLRKPLSFLVGVGTAFGVGLSSPMHANALSWGELIFNGVQLFQLSNVSTDQKVALGRDIHQQVLRNQRLNTNAKTNAYVNRVGQKVAAASDCRQYPFRFFVIQDNSINAFTTTGGYVYVHNGLLNAADNEAQLAGVIAHEIAHNCNDDLISKLRQARLAQGAATIAGLNRSTVANVGYKLAVDLPNSRQAEFEADADGLRYMQRAGYNPSAMPAFLSKLLKYPSPPSFLSDHPGTRDRISALQRRIAAR